MTAIDRSGLGYRGRLKRATEIAPSFWLSLVRIGTGGRWLIGSSWNDTIDMCWRDELSARPAVHTSLVEISCF